MTYLRRGDGPEGARVMLVGEAYGATEEQVGRPFEGASGQLLNGMLHDAGIMRSEVYATNLINARPPGNDLAAWMPTKKKDIGRDHVALHDRMVLPIVREGYAILLGEIDRIKPDIIIACGNAAMWALTRTWGILKWRGSQLTADLPGQPKVLPTIHPAAVLREYAFRPIVVNDLKRAARHRYPGPWNNQPAWNFIIRPSLQTVLDTYAMLMARATEGPIWLDFDIETSPIHITCFSISWSRHDAICVPITSSSNVDGYWSLDEEALVVHGAYRLLTHPNVYVRGQNLLYDCQHTYRHWHFVPNVKQDTMLAHHSMFCGLKKSLDFQASMYCDHYVYWKEMHKDLSNKAGA